MKEATAALLMIAGLTLALASEALDWGVALLVGGLVVGLSSALVVIRGN
jgi:hypothetical protein